METTIRHALETDKAFIYSTWLRGLYYGNDLFKEIDKETYFSNYQKVIDHIMAKPGTEVKVICDSEDQDIILAYSVFSSDTVHWMFTKEAWRKQGFAKRLLPEDVRIVTHLTKPGNAIRKKYNLLYNPFLV